MLVKYYFTFIIDIEIFNQWIIVLFSFGLNTYYTACICSE